MYYIYKIVEGTDGSRWLSCHWHSHSLCRYVWHLSFPKL